MKIPKEIAEKVKRYTALNDEAQKLYKDVEEWLNKNTGADAVYIEDIFMTEEPTGILQEEDEYCEQWSGFCEDDYSGYYYHQIEGTNEYVGYRYST